MKNPNRSLFTFLRKGLRFFPLIALVFCFSVVGAIAQSAPSISNISGGTLAKAGRLKITGANFGATQGAGTVRINGAISPVSSWAETAITAYVPDSATSGSGAVEVITGGGTSNSVPFNVTERTSGGRVQWRFQADDAYIMGRPAVGPDGTIYAAGVGGHLYALSADGGVRWIFRGSFPVIQSVSLGADGTIYFAGANVIHAVNPDGTLKWQIANPSSGQIVAGPNVGPDGNIYAVGSLGNNDPNQLGAITISPSGAILRNRPGYLEPRTQAYFNREIVFGSGQFYFGSLNNVPFGTSGLEVFQLGGVYRLTIAAGGRQPAVGVDGTVYCPIGANVGSPERLGAFSPTDGHLIRTLLPNETYLGYPDIGSDGTIYITHNISVVSGYTPSGASLWSANLGGILGNAIVNEQNTVVSVGGYDISEPGTIYGLSNSGQLLWSVALPEENGGYVRTMSRARFSTDGRTVYYGTDVNDYAADVYSYLYAVTASTGPVPTPTPTALATPTPTPFPTLTPTPSPSPTATPVAPGRTASDFDGDGKADEAVFRPDQGTWYINGSQRGFQAVPFGLANDVLTPADLDGDNKTDVAVFRGGEWYWLRSIDWTVQHIHFGEPGDIPVPADYTGDGRAEVAVFRAGVWYTLDLANNRNLDFVFGDPTDRLVPADYDGDGRSDPAVYRDGVWYIMKSSQGFTAVQFGIASDKPVVSDYDGDGRADPAVFRSGVWYILGSSQGFRATQFGLSDDVPVPADYDGDGRTDIAVFRNGIWYSERSIAGFRAVQFGLPDDRPIPAASAP